ncbi:MAG: hypothetical protein BAA01_02590 [Bacillus thermozeamaize]|uniref:Galactose-1-phosphate uridylyltransferase n=1 Tax=Bacillus thermozeamaize TaxID=230954 RepID=A0A1Y3PQQ5_9BACI|nr:MAG: hypothetical protein BAA01_02590 [Bacillus thermozeamaize]
MAIQFRVEEEWTEFYDPTRNWEPFSRKTEVRYCPLTGDTSRILEYPLGQLNPPDYREIAEKTRQMGCPFCPENLFQVTPRYPEKIHEDGRFKRGEAVVFPNLFPYGKHSGVAIFSGRHYVPLDEFTEEMLTDGFLVAKDCLEAIHRVDPASIYTSINWNYMPMAGASIIHPHLQVVATPHPSNYQRKTLSAARQFLEHHGIHYYTTLIQEEKKRGQRWIGENEALAWVHSFAPQGQMDILGIFKEVETLAQLTEEKIRQMARDLLVIFSYLKENRFVSFNLGFFVPVIPSPGYRVHVRIIPRTTLGMIGTSEINYFKVLHNEPLSLKKPEATAQELRKLFEKREAVKCNP